MKGMSVNVQLQGKRVLKGDGRGDFQQDMLRAPSRDLRDICS